MSMTVKQKLLSDSFNTQSARLLRAQIGSLMLVAGAYGAQTTEFGINLTPENFKELSQPAYGLLSLYFPNMTEVSLQDEAAFNQTGNEGGHPK